MKIEIEVSDKNECTAAPWWVIIDPRQNFQTGEDGLHNIASMITGPFFSREEGENWLRVKSYHFSKNARVYCHSGSNTFQYADKVKF